MRTAGPLSKRTANGVAITPWNATVRSQNAMTSWQVPKLATAPAAVAQKERALISQRTKDALKGRVLSGRSFEKAYT